MKTKDIIVGAKYSHARFPKTVYLGVGRGKFKRLAIIKNHNDEMIGLLVQTQHSLKVSAPSFWDGFYRL